MEELVGFRIVDKCNYITSGNDTLQFPIEYDWCTPVYKVVHDTIDVPLDKTQGEILRLLNDIYVDGVGYNDVVGVVAVPLIIALFAFSFPFVFDRINQINDKYQSKILSTLFSSFLLYKLYWYVSLISIVYVLVYGACTLFCKDNVLVDYAVIWNGISLSVVIVYVLIVWFFARITVKYNDPEQLLGILDTQYKYERKISDIKVWRLKAKAFFRYSRHRKDVEGNSAFISAKNMVSRWQEKMPEENYLYRINEIARYAIKQDDFGLFQNTLKRIDGTIEREKRNVSKWNTKIDANDVIQEGAQHNMTMGFFLDLMLDFKPFSRGYMSNETIVFKMVGAFNMSMYLHHNDSMYLAACLRRMIDKDNEALIFKYIDYTSYYFKYICFLPRLHYIKGGNTNERNKVESKSFESWRYLAVFHYAALAYGFGRGKYALLNIHLNDHYDVYNLYPKSGAEALIRYAQCKDQSVFFKNELLFDKNTDVHKVLARYTSALIMLLSNEGEKGIDISDDGIVEYIKIIESEKKRLKEEAEIVKHDKKLIDIYPYLENVDFEKILDAQLKQLRSINDLPTLKEKQKPNSCLITKIFRFFNAKQDKKETILNLYKMALDDNILADFKQRFDQFDNDIARYIPQGLFADKPENKVEKELVNPCQLLVHKLLFLDFSLYSFGRNIYYDFVEIISNRILYLALCAFRKMKMREKTLVYPDFDLFFEEFTRGKVEDYVLIGIESPFHAVLNIRYVGYKVFYRKIVPYIEIDAVGARNKLNDLDNYEYFKNSLLIVNKSDLPAIVCSSNENVSIDFKEETDESKMKMNVRTTVDVHKEIRFNKTAEIAVVRLKQMSLG